MTRPMTKAQLSYMAVRIDRRPGNDALVRFLTHAVVSGVGVGIVAALVLLSDTFGLLGLVWGHPNRSPRHSPFCSAAL